MREPAADEFGDFERTHPDAARLVNADDFGERLLLLRRPRRAGSGDGGRGVTRGRSGWPWRRNSSMACASGKIVAHGVLDDLHQFGERKFKRNGGEFRVGLRRHGVGRRDGGAGNGDAHPAAQRGVVAEFGDVGISGALDMREPVARFRMDVDFVERMAFDLVGVNPQNEMAVGGLRVQLRPAARASNPSARKASAGRARSGKVFWCRRLRAVRFPPSQNAARAASGRANIFRRDR